MGFTSNVSAPAAAGMHSPAAAQRPAPMQMATRSSAAMTPAMPDKPVTYMAYGKEVSISFADIKNSICEKATDAECHIFIETCQAYGLNPFIKDAYLIHYDNKNDKTASSIVLGKSCYLKLAEAHPQYDGFEAGVIVINTEGAFVNREGSLIYDGETLVGGWAKVYRKDRSRPSYDEVKLSEYDQHNSMWQTKPGTMIRKVALVHAMREAFPATFGSLASEEEVSVAPADYEGTAQELAEDEQRRMAYLTEAADKRRPRRPVRAEKPAQNEPVAVADDPFAQDAAMEDGDGQ